MNRKFIQSLLKLMEDSPGESRAKRKNVIYSDSESEREEEAPPKRRRILIESDSSGDENESTSSVNILKLVGENPKQQNEIEIHSDIAEIWQNIMSKGLEKEAKENIIKKIPVLKNCNVSAPKINNEIRGTLSLSARTRDERLQEKQNQIGLIITNMNDVLKTLISSKNEVLIEKTSNSIRLLCDLQFLESETRRALILPGLNKNIKESLEKSKVGNLLFEKNVSDVIKETKNLERSTVDLLLKKKIDRTPYAVSSLDPLNYWGPSTSKKQVHLGGQSQYYHQRGYHRGGGRGQHPNHRSRQPYQRTPRHSTRGAPIRSIRGKNQSNRYN